MTGLSTYYHRSKEGLTVAPPEGMARSVIEFLRLTYDAIENGVLSEFYKTNREDFLGFAQFVYDHQGFYDKARYYYDWRTLQPVVEGIFESGIDLPHKSRLLELTGNFKLAIKALNDDDVVNFILSHFKLYAELEDKVTDKHGRAQKVLEAMYANLQSLKEGKPFEVRSPQWALELLIKKGVYNL